MDVNCFHEVEDASPETIELLADLIEASRTDEQMVYREAELDELWRWIGTGASVASADRRDAVLAEVVAIHDLIEEPENARVAAGRLRAIAVAAAHRP